MIRSGQDLSNQLLNQQAQSILGAVQNLNPGQSTSQGLNDLLNLPQSVEDLLHQNTLLSQGVPTVATQATTDLPSFLQNLGGGAVRGADQLTQQLLGTGQQALSDFNANLTQPASPLSNPTMWALQNLVNPQIAATPPWDPSQVALRDTAMQALMSGQPATAAGQQALNQLGQVFGLAGPIGADIAEAAAPLADTTRMYHGTASDFPRATAAGIAGGAGEGNLFGPGYYLTSDPRVAGGVVQAETTPLNAMQQELAARGLGLPQDVAGTVREPGYAQQRARRLETAGRVGPNVRALDVPNNLNLFDLDQGLTAADHQAIVDSASGRGLEADELGNMPGEGGYDNPDWESLAGDDFVGAKGQSIWQHLAAVTGSKAEANQILADAGYDGLTYQGGKRVPMPDETGTPIQHTANVIFPRSLDQLRNAVSGTQGGQANVGMALGLGGVGLAGLGAQNQQVRDAFGSLLGQLAQPHLTGLAGPLQDLYQGVAGPAPWDPDQQALRDSGMQKLMHGQADQVTPEEQHALNTLGQTVGLSSPNLGGTAADPISVGDWVKSAYRGGVISGLNTAADVAFNSTLTPILSGGAGLARDAAAFSPGRMAGRILGAQSGLADWGGNFLQGLSDSFARPGSVAARAEPGLPTAASRLTEGFGAMHGAFQNATQQLLAAMEQGAAAGEVASTSSGAGGNWFNAFQTAYANPTAETVARAQGLGARAAGRSELGNAANALGNFVSGLNVAGLPVGDALFPVYRMGMNFASRGVEATPVGAAGTALDVLRGMAGYGPYAEIASRGLRNAFDIVPPPRIPGNEAAVGPLGERLANNMIGTSVGVGLWLANQAIGGTITGAGPTDPKQAAIWRANGIQPFSFRPPGSDQYYSYERLPPQLKGPLMAAGAYADAQQAYTEASARAGTAGAAAYNVEDPRFAAAARLFSEVAQDMLSPTPLRTLANLYDTVTSPEAAATASMRGASDLASSVVGGLVPESGLVRSIAQMTDPYQRATLAPSQPQQLPQAIAEQVQQNIPGLRENLPIRPDILGRPIANPLQGLGEVLPVRPGAGQPSPILQAAMRSGATLATAPSSVPYGPYEQVRLTPADQRAWEQMHGEMVQRMAGAMVASPNFQNARPAVQKYDLQLIDQIAAHATSQRMIGVLGPAQVQSRREPNAGGLMAPAVGYGPDVMANQLQLRNQLQAMQAQALMSSLTGGTTGRQTLEALNAQQG
jgi:hypothetical protein